MFNNIYLYALGNKLNKRPPMVCDKCLFSLRQLTLWLATCDSWSQIFSWLRLSHFDESSNGNNKHTWLESCWCALSLGHDLIELIVLSHLGHYASRVHFVLNSFTVNVRMQTMRTFFLNLFQWQFSFCLEMSKNSHTARWPCWWGTRLQHTAGFRVGQIGVLFLPLCH